MPRLGLQPRGTSGALRGPGSDVRFVITPTDETFRKVDKLISNDMREAMKLLGTDNGILGSAYPEHRPGIGRLL